MPPLKQVESLKNLCEEALVEMVFSYETMLVNNIEELISRQDTDTLNGEQQYLLLWYLPDQLYTDFVTRLLEKMKLGYSILFPEDNTEVKVELIQLFINKKLQRLECIDLPKQLVIEIQKRFNFLEQITHFYFCSFIDDVVVMLTPALSNMNNLVSFTLKYYSTNEIIRAISNHCPNLHSLDVSMSQDITNIACLQKCKKLKKLILFDTSVPYYDAAEFLLENKTLSELEMCEDEEILEYLMNKHQSIQHPSSLKQFNHIFSSIEELKFAHSFFPYLQTIECDSEDEIDYSYLKFFKHLKELKCSLENYDESFSSFLHVKGSSLSSLDIVLYFQKCEKLIYDLIICCPNLKILSFQLCDWLNLGQKYKNKLHIKQSWNLENLRFISHRPTNNLELILVNTPNIKCVEIDYEKLDDDTLCNILSANPMSNLEVFTLMDRHKLSMKSLRLLLTSCPRLKVIRNIEHWIISDEESHALERDIKYFNWDLNITKKCNFE